MLGVTRVKMSDSEKKSEEHVRHFLHKTSNQEVSRSCRAKQRQRNVQKKCAARAFLLIRPIFVFFTVLVAFAA